MLQYADMIYDKTYNFSFLKQIESIQCNACLAITVTVRVTSTEKLYQELGSESLKLRHWFRKLCHFYKILHRRSPVYLI